MEDLYDRLRKNISKKAFMELMIGRMVLEEINKILVPGFKQKNSEDENLVKKLLKYLEDQNGPAIIDGAPEKTVHEDEQVLKKITASDANRKIIPISEGCRTGRKGKKPVNLKFIQGRWSSYQGHPGKSSLHPYLKLVPINNSPTITFGPNEAA